MGPSSRAGLLISDSVCCCLRNILGSCSSFDIFRQRSFAKLLCACVENYKDTIIAGNWSHKQALMYVKL